MMTEFAQPHHTHHIHDDFVEAHAFLSVYTHGAVNVNQANEVIIFIWQVMMQQPTTCSRRHAAKESTWHDELCTNDHHATCAGQQCTGQQWNYHCLSQDDAMQRQRSLSTPRLLNCTGDKQLQGPASMTAA
jgi:hypothetical protein